MGPSCVSKFCERSKNHACKHISKEERKKLFESFWAMESWEERKTFVRTSVVVIDVKQRRSGPEESRRSKSFVYRFKIDGRGVHVCKNMFCNTLGISPRTIGAWIAGTDAEGQKATENVAKDCNKAPKTGKHAPLSEEDAGFLKAWLAELPTVPSHYCRNVPSYQNKHFLFPGTTISQLHDQYKKDASAAGKRSIGYDAFSKTFRAMDYSIFVPRKDQCDLCTSAKHGNVEEEKIRAHMKAKDDARREKVKDKEEASFHTSVWTMDTQAVLLCPKTNASALYYKTKLQVHNLTFYNLKTKEGYCKVWDETEGDLSSEMFAYLQFRHFEDYLRSHPSIQTLIVWSDGCSYQNKNCNLANVYLYLSETMGVRIEQKYLVPGHTQMEADSIHSTIEQKIKGDIFTPRDYVVAMQTARNRPFPYHVEEIVHSDVQKLSAACLSSIRPGSRVGDPTVSEIRGLRYETDGSVHFKLSFEDEWQIHPQRITKHRDIHWKRLFDARKPIKARKWKDLQSMKHVMPRSVHSFYDTLPHE
ncbi:hypothetical protein BaRGS_00040017 [Batillaria attramentaria]|uniref:Uncharacterized protein n=1 Tax=Batillaria attramentaria TaxID=370345 RepID=A0ABD0J1B7_9CAEN